MCSKVPSNVIFIHDFCAATCEYTATTTGEYSNLDNDLLFTNNDEYDDGDHIVCVAASKWQQYQYIKIATRRQLHSLWMF